MTDRPLPEAERAAFEAWIRNEYGADVTWESGEDSPAFAPLPQYADTVDPEETRNEREERSLWEEWSAWKARAAIAAAMAPGEPVAWAVFKGDSYEWVHDDEAKARENERDGYRIVPLYAAPPALPASVERRMAFMEVERAVAEEREACAKACDRVQEKLECGGEEQDLAAAYVAKKCAAAIRARGGAK